MLRELFLSLTLTLTLTPGVASSNYGDCSCTCCAKVHPDLDCTPQYLGHNTLSSCASCSADFCAHQWPTACPSGPTSGGKDNFGGHNTFKCDGWADDPRAAPTLSGAAPTPSSAVTGACFILLILVLICCCAAKHRQRYAPVAPVPMGQPVGQWPAAQAVAQQPMGMQGMGVGAYYPPQPPPQTVFVQPAQAYRPASGVNDFVAGSLLGAVGGTILGAAVGGGGGGGGGGHATHSEGGFGGGGFGGGGGGGGGHATHSEGGF